MKHTTYEAPAMQFCYFGATDLMLDSSGATHPGGGLQLPVAPFKKSN